MERAVFNSLVKKHHGWIEDDCARFPSVWNKDQFERETALIETATALAKDKVAAMRTAP